GGIEGIAPHPEQETNHGQSGNGDGHQQRSLERRRRLSKQAEGRAGVLQVGEAEEARNNGDGVIQHNVVDNQQFGDAVEDEDYQGNQKVAHAYWLTAFSSWGARNISL